MGDCSNLTVADSGRDRNSRASLRKTGTRKPMNLSPAPYSPGAVLKNQLKFRAWTGEASCRRRDRKTDREISTLVRTAEE